MTEAFFSYNPMREWQGDAGMESPLRVDELDQARRPIPGKRVSRRTLFFILMAILMLVVVGLGFGKSFFFRPAFNTTPLPAYLVVHGITMTAWFGLFFLQVILIRVRRPDIHRTLGLIGILLAAGVVVTAIIVNLNVIPRAMAAGILERPEDGLEFVLGSLSSLPPFVILVGLAVAYRRKRDMHKRLMFWSFVWMLGPAFTNTRPLGRFLDPLVQPYLDFFPADFIWLAALVGYDWLTLRRIHPATYVPFGLLFVYFVFVTPWIVTDATLQGWLLAYLAR